MADLHQLGAYAALALSILALPWAAIVLVAGREPGRFFFANLVWVVIALLVTSLVGLTIALLGSPPTDPLHLVYGALVTVAWPVAGLLAAGRPPRERAVVTIVAAIVVLVLLARLFQTGG